MLLVKEGEDKYQRGSGGCPIFRLFRANESRLILLGSVNELCVYSNVDRIDHRKDYGYGYYRNS